VAKNVVFILADDLGGRDLGCYGSDYYETPNLDRLAGEGMRFTQAYTAHPVCSPTRASVLSGRYPARLHLTSFIPGYRKPGEKLLPPPDWIKYLRDSEVTYAEAFREAGFATFHVGKWHVDKEYAGEESPGRQGFEYVHAGVNPWEKNVDDPHHLKEFTQAIETFVEGHAGERFLAVLSMDQVHVPIYEHPEWIARFADKPAGSNGQNNPVMAAMIARMDWSVGRVLDKLDELGLSDNTAVVFFSDNGGLENFVESEEAAETLVTSNLPYRGGKSKIYEGGIRVPLIIKWPGVTRSGSTCDVPVISMDLYPTFLSLAGLPPRPEQHLDGLSLAPLLKGGDALERNTLYWHYPHYQTLPPHSAIRHQDWKMVHHYETGESELFNLAEDVGETNDLSRKKPELTAQLEAWLMDHLKTIGAPMPEPNPDYDPNTSSASDWSREDFDPYEDRQDEDPRTLVTDPNLDYGALR
jgi:arylsulfatase A-like enzyme